MAEITKINAGGTTYDIKDAGAKRLQSAVSDPTAGATAATAFISSISQNAEGVITATKSPIPSDISGNAGTATKLSNTRNIDGILFDGSANVNHFATTDSASGTINLVNSNFTLASGSRYTIVFTAAIGYSDSTNGLKININSTGAKAVKHKGSNVTALQPNIAYEFVYNGTDYILLGERDTNTTYVTDGTYNSSSNKIATQTTVNNAIESLDVGPFAGATNKTITSISETDGKISVTYSNIGSLNTSALTAGTLGVARGGTGASSFTTNRVILSNASNTDGALAVSSVTKAELEAALAGYESASTVQTRLNNLENAGTISADRLKNRIKFYKGSIISTTTAVTPSSIVGAGQAYSSATYVDDFLIGTNGGIARVTATSSSSSYTVAYVGIMSTTTSYANSYNSSTTTLTLPTTGSIAITYPS